MRRIHAQNPSCGLRAPTCVTLRIGDQLPGIALQDPEGHPVSLASLTGEPTLLIFLRHLGCLPCREHLIEVLAQRKQLGLRIVCVTFSAAELLAGFRRELHLDEALILLGDPERRAYEAFGFERGSIARVWLHPRVWRRYAQLLRAGRRPISVRQDTLQLGGDVLADASGRIRFIYRSRGPDDRPSIARIAAAKPDAVQRGAHT